MAEHERFCECGPCMNPVAVEVPCHDPRDPNTIVYSCRLCLEHMGGLLLQETPS